MGSEQPVSNCGSLAGHLAVVTGASSGVGKAIAIALAKQGARLALVGRNSVALTEVAAIVKQHSQASEFQIDLATGDIQPLVEYVERDGGQLHILVHSAGIIHPATMESSSLEDFDSQFATNVRAPFALTKSMLPFLLQAQGQVVFINSSAGLSAKRADIGAYAASKHALKALADSLREEVNSRGVRVLSMYLGRVATPMQEALLQQEGKTYAPEKLLQPEDIAAMVIHSLMLPTTAEVTDISIRPMKKL